MKVDQDMPKYFLLMVFAFMALFLAACADEDHYPISGEDCAPEDPVQTLDANLTDCAPNA